MHIASHNLFKEFPELRGRIQQLQQSDGHFASQLDKYHALDEKIRVIESGNEAASDEHLTHLKKQRIQLKDELFGLLNKAA